ncbi:MAG: hypothetical protein ACRBB0_01530 [Pelagimonas sp.]|uniref:hypothetical protein n=1 Tax=Pelagimonas sp. TaxID=2073170 RepID=UPI003D6BF5DF
MPVSYHISPTHQLIIISFIERYSAGETLEMFAKYTADPKFDETYQLVLDLTRASSVDASFSEMRKVVQEVGPRLSNAERGLCVFIVPNDFFFGVARMYQTMINDYVPYEIEIKRNKQDAADLLGVPLAALSPTDA